MTTANVYVNHVEAGTICRVHENRYTFAYCPNYLAKSDAPPIGIHFPKREEVFESEELFPLFFNMLSEGINRKVQCHYLKIDEKDFFTLLLKTAVTETIGAITIKQVYHHDE